MTLLGFRSNNHPQQVARRGADLPTDDRATVPELFEPLNERYRFTIDVAAAAHNTKCERFYTVADDGLAQDWTGERVWCNPPYSDIRPWVAKAWGSDALVVMLLPANRTEQAWWQDLVEPYRDRSVGLTCEFLRRRRRVATERGHHGTGGPDLRTVCSQLQPRGSEPAQSTPTATRSVG